MVPQKWFFGIWCRSTFLSLQRFVDKALLTSAEQRPQMAVGTVDDAIKTWKAEEIGRIFLLQRDMCFSLSGTGSHACVVWLWVDRLREKVEGSNWVKAVVSDRTAKFDASQGDIRGGWARALISVFDSQWWGTSKAASVRHKPSSGRE